jgi:(p)ppGpp synthase/HD superfamily hydrolase
MLFPVVRSTLLQCNALKSHSENPVESGISKQLGPRFSMGLAYATTIYGGQTRKGSAVPYISHPLAVASLTLEHGGNEDEAIAALLHDAAEDHGGASRIRDIDAHFGQQVAYIVEQCTDTSVLPKVPARQRREAFFRLLLDTNESVLLVSASERLHNLRAVVTGLRVNGSSWWERYNIEPPKMEGTLWYYGEYLRVFRLLAEKVRASDLTNQLIDEYAATLEATIILAKSSTIAHSRA